MKIRIIVAHLIREYHRIVLKESNMAEDILVSLVVDIFLIDLSSEARQILVILKEFVQIKIANNSNDLHKFLCPKSDYLAYPPDRPLSKRPPENFLLPMRYGAFYGI